MQKIKLPRKDIITIQTNADVLQYCPKVSFEDMINLKRTAKSLKPVLDLYNESYEELLKRYYKQEAQKDGTVKNAPIVSKEIERKQAFKDLLEQEQEVEVHYIRLSKIKPLLEDPDGMGFSSGTTKVPYHEFAINLIDLLILEDEEYDKIVKKK